MSVQQPQQPTGNGPQVISGEESEDEARKRREQLNRRPSYRMILKDLETADKVLKKEPEETPPSSVDASPLQVHIPLGSSATQQRLAGGGPSPYSSPLPGGLIPSSGHGLHLNGDITGQLQHNIDFAAALAAATSSHQNTPTASSAGTSVVLPMSTDNQLMKPLSMDPSSFAGQAGFLQLDQDWHSPMLSGYSSSPSPTIPGGTRGMGGGEDESTRKRQVRLLKNREAAKECRRKKKEYVKCLENRVAVLENQNKALIEELKTLKELYCRKEKNDM